MKKQEEPKQKNNQTKQKNNACTRSFVKEQVFTLALFAIVFILHSIFIIPTTLIVNDAILWVVFSTTYVLVVFLIVDYLALALNDPSIDKLESIEGVPKENLYICQGCKNLINFESHHFCKRCNRCIEQFDHHCRYLNLCIASKNYIIFIRLLLMAISYLVVVLVQCIWIFVVFQDNEELKDGWASKWAILVEIVFSVVALLLVFSLIFFHYYLCCKGLTTWLWINLDSENSSSSQSKMRSAQHLETKENMEN